MPVGQGGIQPGAGFHRVVPEVQEGGVGIFDDPAVYEHVKRAKVLTRSGM